MRVLRVIVMIVFALGAGVVTTLLIAWWCAGNLPASVRQGEQAMRSPTNDRFGARLWRLERRGALDVTLQTGMVIMTDMSGIDASPDAIERRVPKWSSDMLVPWGWNAAWQPGMRSLRHLMVRGWPMPALAAVLESTSDSPEGPGGWIVIDGIDRSPPRTNRFSTVVPHVRPTRVVWPGFAADVAILGGAWLALFTAFWFAARTTQRAIRRAGGRCPWCGYAKRGQPHDARCPECGR